MQTREDNSLASIEIALFGGSLGEIRTKIADANLGKLWSFVDYGYTDQSLTLKGAARAACVSPDHLNELLREACGFTFKQLLIRRRLLAGAQALVTENDARVDELALRVGFGDVSSFQRQFKKCIGLAPTALRRWRSQKFW